MTPDGYEPNDDFTSASSLGLIGAGGSRSVSGNFHTPTDRDFFRVSFSVDAGGGFCIPFTTIYRTATFTLATPAVGSNDYDLYVYNVNGTLWSFSNRGGYASESVTLSLSHVCGTATDTYWFTVEYRRYSGTPMPNAYTGTMSMN